MSIFFFVEEEILIGSSEAGTRPPTAAIQDRLNLTDNAAINSEAEDDFLEGLLLEASSEDEVFLSERVHNVKQE